MSYSVRTGDDSSTLSTLSLPDRSTSDSRLERRAIKRSLGIPIAVTDYAPVGTTSWADAFNDAQEDVWLSADRRLYIPSGNYDLYAPWVIDYPINVFGDSLSLSVVVAKHTGNAIVLTGLVQSGPQITDLSVGFSGVAGSAAIIADSYQNPSDPTDYRSPNSLRLERLNITAYSGGTMAYNIVLNGNGVLDDNGGTVPIGVRNVTLRDIRGFLATTRGLDCRHVRVGLYTGVNIYGSPGGASTNAIDPAHPCFNNIFLGCTINGTFAIADSSETKLYGVTTTVTTGSGVTGFINL